MHRRVRRLLFWRFRCECGLRWPCPDRRQRQPGQGIPHGNAPSWQTVTTAAYPHTQVGRAGRLTPAQRFRANKTAR